MSKAAGARPHGTTRTVWCRRRASGRQQVVGARAEVQAEAEVLEILCRRVRAGGVHSAPIDALRPRLALLMHTLGYTDAALADAHSDGVTLRHVLKLLGRLLRPDAWARRSSDRDKGYA